MIREVPHVAVNDSANVWVKHLNENRNRIGSWIQAQHTTANYWLSAVENPPSLLLCKKINAQSIVNEDLWPSQDALYVLSDTAGTGLTVIEKFNTAN